METSKIQKKIIDLRKKMGKMYRNRDDISVLLEQEKQLMEQRELCLKQS